MSERPKLLIVGYGAIGQALAGHLVRGGAAEFDVAVLSRHGAPGVGAPRLFATLDEALAFAPALAVECAGHAAVREQVPALLAAGIPTVVASVGALADDALVESLRAMAVLGRSRLILPSGAIGGLDYVAAVAGDAEAQVAYRSLKPPAAWHDELAALGIDAATLQTPYTLFDGSARDAARRYPQNLNVAATLALHGIGMQRTRVTVIADPSVTLNTHEVSVTSRAGRANLRFENTVSADNPKTSALTSLSLYSEAVRFLRGTYATLEHS